MIMTTRMMMIAEITTSIITGIIYHFSTVLFTTKYICKNKHPKKNHHRHYHQNANNNNLTVKNKLHYLLQLTDIIPI